MLKNNAIAKRAENYDAANPERAAGRRFVTMTNALTRAGQGLTLAEKRIVASAVAKLDSRKQLRPGTAPTTQITAAEYAEAFGVDMDTAYNQLKSAAQNLYSRSITFYTPAYLRDGKPCTTKSTMRWVGRIEYHEKEGWVELFWWYEVLPHLTGIKRNFTTYQLQQASALRSIYSWRLLELLMRFEDTGWAEYTIEDFCASMDATEKQRSDFGNIRKRMIEPAVKELIEKDNWMIEWYPIKAGRRVKALRFDFSRNPQHRLPL